MPDGRLASSDGASSRCSSRRPQRPSQTPLQLERSLLISFCTRRMSHHHHRRRPFQTRPLPRRSTLLIVSPPLCRPLLRARKDPPQPILRGLCHLCFPKHRSNSRCPCCDCSLFICVACSMINNLFEFFFIISINFILSYPHSERIFEFRQFDLVGKYSDYFLILQVYYVFIILIPLASFW